MSIALHGNLRDFGMSEVFQLIGQQRKTGVLQVRGASGEVELRFDAGGIVSAAPVGASEDAALGEMAVRCGLLPRERLAELERARAEAGDRLARHILESGIAPEALREIEDLLTRETLFDLLRWDDGSFRFVAQAIPHDRAPDSLLGAEQVLMDGLRMVDEWRAFAAELPPENAILRRRVGFEEYRGSPAGRGAASPAETERLFRLIDERSSVRQVIDRSRLGTFGGMRILVELARGGWIEPVHAPTAERSSGGSGPLRTWAARIGPFAALAALAAFALLRGSAGVPGAPLPVDAIAQARGRYEAVGVRHLALADRLARGRWPDSLEKLPRWPDGAGRALARAEAGAYYLARRAEDPPRVRGSDPHAAVEPEGPVGPGQVGEDEAEGVGDPGGLGALGALGGLGGPVILAPER